MAFVFKPAIWRTGQSLLDLPQPIHEFRIKDATHQDQHEVPMKQGGVTYGPALGPVEISVSGEIAVVDSDIVADDSDMLDAILDVREYIRAVTDATPLELFFFHDTASSTYRKFKSVFCDALELDIGDQTRVTFSYEIVFHADDPVVYTTAPGA